MKSYCIDFDDLCDGVMVQRWRNDDIHLVDFLAAWKERCPPLKVTLFTIPTRTSDATIAALRSLGPWVALAPHGWRHTRGECLAWTADEAIAKIRHAASRGIDAPCFRAPAWLIDGDVYTACHALGYAVASHMTFRIPHTGFKEYVYNLHMGAFPPSTRRVHGHLTPVAGNHIYDLHHDGLLRTDSKGVYYFPWEVAGEVKEGVVQPGGEA